MPETTLAEVMAELAALCTTRTTYGARPRIACLTITCTSVSQRTTASRPTGMSLSTDPRNQTFHY